jgi:hypothetical protein
VKSWINTANLQRQREGMGTTNAETAAAPLPDLSLTITSMREISGLERFLLPPDNGKLYFKHKNEDELYLVDLRLLSVVAGYGFKQSITLGQSKNHSPASYGFR